MGILEDIVRQKQYEQTGQIYKAIPGVPGTSFPPSNIQQYYKERYDLLRRINQGDREAAEEYIALGKTGPARSDEEDIRRMARERMAQYTATKVASVKAQERLADLKEKLAETQLTFKMERGAYDYQSSLLEKKGDALYREGVDLTNKISAHNEESTKLEADYQSFIAGKHQKDAAIEWKELVARSEKLAREEQILSKAQTDFLKKQDYYEKQLTGLEKKRLETMSTGQKQLDIWEKMKPEIATTYAYDISGAREQIGELKSAGLTDKEIVKMITTPPKAPELRDIGKTKYEVQKKFWETRKGKDALTPYIPIASELFGSFAAAGRLVGYPAEVVAEKFEPERGKREYFDIDIGKPKKLEDFTKLPSGSPWEKITTYPTKEERVQTWGQMAGYLGEVAATYSFFKIGELGLRETFSLKETAFKWKPVKPSEIKLTFAGEKLPEIKGLSLYKGEPQFKYGLAKTIYDDLAKAGVVKKPVVGIYAQSYALEEATTPAFTTLPPAMAEGFISIEKAKGGIELVWGEPVSYSPRAYSYLGKIETIQKISFPEKVSTLIKTGKWPGKFKVSDSIFQARNIPIAGEQPLGTTITFEKWPTTQIFKGAYPFEESKGIFLVGDKTFEAYPITKSTISLTTWEKDLGKLTELKLKGFGRTTGVAQITPGIGETGVYKAEVLIDSKTWLEGFTARIEKPFKPFVKEATTTKTGTAGLKSLQQMYEKAQLKEIALEFEAIESKRHLAELQSLSKATQTAAKGIEATTGGIPKMSLGPSVISKTISLELPAQPIYSYYFPVELKSPALQKDLTMPQLTITTTLPRLDEKLRIKSSALDSLTASLEKTQLKEIGKLQTIQMKKVGIGQISQTKSLTAQLTEQAQKQSLTDLSKLGSLNIQIPSMAELTIAATKTKTIQEQKLTPFTIPSLPPITPPPEIKLFWFPFDFKKFDWELPKISKKEAQGFYVFGKRKGKFFKLSEEPLTKQSALGLGFKWADITAGATIKLEPALKPASKKKYWGWLTLGKKFYTKGPLTFIERPKYRISTLGEKEEITFKGLKTLRELNFKSLFGGGKKMAKKRRKRKKKRR